MVHKFDLMRASILVALLAGGQGAAGAGELDDARRMLGAGQAQAALDRLLVMEGERAGDPDYDYLLGIAALDAGRPGTAVFALERVVAMQPDNAQARAELARAYFMLHDNELAKQELENVKAMAPPEPVQATINKYLDALDQRFEALRTHVSVYAQAGIGFDTNINAATGDDDFVIPLNRLSARDRIDTEENAVFLTGQLGAGITHSVTPDLYFFVRGRLSGRENTGGEKLISAGGEDFDDHRYGADIGLRYFKGANTFTATLSGERMNLNDVSYRSSGGLSLQWQHALDARNQLTGFVRTTNLRYQESTIYPGNPLNDADQWLVGAAWGHEFGGQGSPVLFASVYYAEDDERRKVSTTVNGVPVNTSGLVARDFWGLRVGGQYTLDERWDLVGSATAQFSDYDGPHPSFSDREREDDFYHLSVGGNYKASRQWLVRPRLTYTNNDSNVNFSDYDRWQAHVTARYTFK
ncbi:MAG: tetratricopeptide repeat protein [Gammaproteobacteria bacterium]|nr:tetratricopeptide repeat protein [Gammaproteobacteria bacterium]